LYGIYESFDLAKNYRTGIFSQKML
jgi:hypothetical protein